MNAPVKLPRAPRHLWSNIIVLWRRGYNTHQIAAHFNLTEAEVANALHDIREART